MLPMGTIMAACMVIGVLFAARPLGLNRASPRRLLVAVGVLLALGGLWNAGWHAPRHLGDFWGRAALASGLTMLVVSAHLLFPDRLPPWLGRGRSFMVLALTAFALLYGVALYRL